MDRDEIIGLCHRFGFKQREIVAVLSSECGLVLSVRQLRRILRQLNLQRRNRSDILEVTSFLAGCLNSSAQQHGYRIMHLRCTLAGLSVAMHDVRILLKMLDPEGVDLRRRRRLVRRRYYSKGPNFMWHIDSYDKLKPYGIAVNGCIDGFSRYIVWLEANYTASDPKVVGGYFIDTVEALGGCPELIRGDRGTENVVVEKLQTFLHETLNNENETGHFRYGRSTANQRIESWWCFLRRQCTEFWISFFQEFRRDGLFNGELLEKELIRFVFMEIIQNELDEIKTLWNLHPMRRTRNDQLAHGRPIVLFNSPNDYDTHDYIRPIADPYIEACKEECTLKDNIFCDHDVNEVCLLLMQEHGWNKAVDARSGRELYKKLREILEIVL